MCGERQNKRSYHDFTELPNLTVTYMYIYVSMSVVLKLFHVKDDQNDMYLATDPHLKIFSSRDPLEAKF